MKVFRFEHLDSTAVVIPQGSAADFRYFEVHIELNSIIQELDRDETTKLVVDLAEVNLVDGVIVDSIIRMVRRVTNRGGKASICSASPASLKILRSMRLDKLWPIFASRTEALQSLEDLN